MSLSLKWVPYALCRWAWSECLKLYASESEVSVLQLYVSETEVSALSFISLSLKWVPYSCMSSLK